jgi:hypothetical protein
MSQKWYQLKAYDFLYCRRIYIFKIFTGFVPLNLKKHFSAFYKTLEWRTATYGITVIPEWQCGINFIRYGIRQLIIARHSI